MSKKTSRQNIRKRGDTYTYYAYVTGPDGTRQQISKGGFKTQAQAADSRLKLLSSVQDGTFVQPERMTLREFLLDEWLPTKRPPNLEESTHVSYARNIRLHVIPHIGNIRLQQLTPIHLNKLYRTLLDSGRKPTGVDAGLHTSDLVTEVVKLKKKGKTCQAIADMLNEQCGEDTRFTRHTVSGIYRRSKVEKAEPRHEREPGLSPRMVEYVHSILHVALKDAMRWSRVSRNVADAASPPPKGSTRSARVEHWDADQLGRFLTFVAEDRYLPAWVFLATTGCRRGEALGIGWSDINFESKTALISRQVSAIDHVVVVKALPKTKRAHLIRLDGATIDMLKRWRSFQNQERLLVGPGYDDQDFVFAMPDGTPYNPDRFSRQFTRKQEQHNKKFPDVELPRLVLHGLRHTWATLALAEGIDIKIVSERLNHSSTHVTREIYTHVTPPMQSDAAERVAGRIFRM